MEPLENKYQKKKPDRPLECSECRKPITVIYTEIVGDIMTQTSMCADCPELQKRLHGVLPDHKEEGQEERAGSIACGSCGITLEGVKKGSPLGCPTCYDVFQDAILNELRETDKLPQRLLVTAKSVPIHIGRNPDEIMEMTPSIRLIALNEALNETLKKENYEQAAMLRDQIQALTESENNNNDK